MFEGPPFIMFSGRNLAGALKRSVWQAFSYTAAPQGGRIRRRLNPSAVRNAVSAAVGAVSALAPNAIAPEARPDSFAMWRGKSYGYPRTVSRFRRSYRRRQVRTVGRSGYRKGVRASLRFIKSGRGSVRRQYLRGVRGFRGSRRGGGRRGGSRRFRSRFSSGVSRKLKKVAESYPDIQCHTLDFRGGATLYPPESNNAAAAAVYGVMPLVATPGRLDRCCLRTLINVKDPVPLSLAAELYYSGANDASRVPIRWIRTKCTFMNNSKLPCTIQLFRFKRKSHRLLTEAATNLDLNLNTVAGLDYRIPGWDDILQALSATANDLYDPATNPSTNIVRKAQFLFDPAFPMLNSPEVKARFTFLGKKTFKLKPYGDSFGGPQNKITVSKNIKFKDGINMADYYVNTINLGTRVLSAAKGDEMWFVRVKGDDVMCQSAANSTAIGCVGGKTLPVVFCKMSQQVCVNKPLGNAAQLQAAYTVRSEQMSIGYVTPPTFQVFVPNSAENAFASVGNQLAISTLVPTSAHQQ